jgi:hypothetical protein
VNHLPAQFKNSFGETQINAGAMNASAQTQAIKQHARVLRRLIRLLVDDYTGTD